MDGQQENQFGPFSFFANWQLRVGAFLSSNDLVEDS
jgi:hypothetical protein